MFIKPISKNRDGHNPDVFATLPLENASGQIY